jgi:hypothetical protein
VHGISCGSGSGGRVQTGAGRDREAPGNRARRTPLTDQILAGERGQQKKPAEGLPRFRRVRSVAIAVRRPIGLGLSCVGFPRVKKGNAVSRARRFGRRCNDTEETK